MRSIFRSVLVALVAILALGAVAASGASAHEYFIEGKSMKERGLTEEAISGKGSTAASLEFAGVKITCTSSSLSGTIKQGGGGTAALTLASCFVNSPAGCEVAEPIVFNTSSGLVETQGALADRFAIEHGVALTFHGAACSLTTLTGSGQVTGLVVSEAEQEAGTFNFNSVSGSELVVGGAPALLKLKENNIKLSGANATKHWSAKK